MINKKKKNLIKKILKTDNKLYKTGKLLAHAFTAVSVANIMRGGGGNYRGK